MMDFYLSTPQGDVHLFSTEDGRTVQVPAAAGSGEAIAQKTSAAELGCPTPEPT